MRWGLQLVAGALSGCGTATPAVDAGPRLVVEQAHLWAGAGVEVTAARATLDDAERGHGESVWARLPAPEPGAAKGGDAAAGAVSSGGDEQAAVETAASGARPPLLIEAPRSEWDLKRRTVRFTGGVEATRGPVRLRCDELTVRYAEGDRVEEAVASGSVVVERDGRRATGDRAVLTTDDGRITLSGAPLLQQGGSTLSGARIELFLDDERARCDQCRLVVDGDALRPAP